MEDDLRRAVAYIAGRILTGAPASAVYDHAAARHFHFSGEVAPERVSVYDHGRGCQISGAPPSLFDHGTSRFLKLEVKAGVVAGYDYASGTFYEATVTGAGVSVYDPDAGGHFGYSI